jgi:hypothetical protein
LTFSFDIGENSQILTVSNKKQFNSSILNIQKSVNY